MSVNNSPDHRNLANSPNPSVPQYRFDTSRPPELLPAPETAQPISHKVEIAAARELQTRTEQQPSHGSLAPPADGKISGTGTIQFASRNTLPQKRVDLADASTESDEDSESKTDPRLAVVQDNLIALAKLPY